MADTCCMLLAAVVLPAGPRPAVIGKHVDLAMLVMNNGGRESAETGYRTLLARAGLRLTRIVPCAGRTSLVEAVPGSRSWSTGESAPIGDSTGSTRSAH